jgi:tetratricopeptide (TPR) repeat protein
MVYFDKIMKTERNAEIRGNFYYKKFTYLSDVDSTEAFNLASKLIESDEKGFRLFIYMGLDLDSRGRNKLAGDMFIKAMDIADNSSEKSFAGMLYGELLSVQGKDDLALKVLEKSEENAFASKYLGKILWEKGERKKAIKTYINLAAGVLGQRGEIKLDSLYAIIYPRNPGELDEKIFEVRIAREKLLNTSRFVDAEGKYYNLSDYKGEKLVISAWSPT